MLHGKGDIFVASLHLESSIHNVEIGNPGRRYTVPARMDKLEINGSVIRIYEVQSQAALLAGKEMGELIHKVTFTKRISRAQEKPAAPIASIRQRISDRLPECGELGDAWLRSAR